MSRNSLITCAACLVLAVSSAFCQSVSDVVKRSSDAVVQIVISDLKGQETALGSGFLISSDGKTVTNYHVIKGAHSAIVKLSNGAFFPVEGVLAVDVDKDLAILKVPGKNLPFLALGNATDVHIGDHVIAIGSPLGLEGTVSDGIVSAIRDEKGKKWIQTTAPVSHGNSGGPLLDLSGNVQGVITWGVNLQLGQNLNFAAVSDEVKTLVARAHAPAPLDSTPEPQSDALPKLGEASTSSIAGVWTSLATGHDYRVRRDGDHIYAEWVNMPAELNGTGAFMRTDFKLGSDGVWHGETHGRLPCTYRNNWNGQNVVNWCSIHHTGTEINKLTDTRIEGISVRFEKLDCRKCEYRGEKKEPFTFIPKD